MIFVTVGAQMPFDRMVRAVDAWAARRGRRDVFAQIGPTSFSPVHIEWSKFLDPEAFRAKVEAASLIVAHAGMGSIITALEIGKPIIIMPRRGDLKETRNDHQLATAREFQAQRRVVVAFDEGELGARLDELDGVVATERISARASGELTESLLGFVERGLLPARKKTGFDGVVCFGSRQAPEGGELAMMREFSRQMPVLYVNLHGGKPNLAGPLGPLMPRARALGQLFRRSKRVSCNLSVMHGVEIGDAAGGNSRERLASQVRVAARRMGILAPLIWVSDPAAAAVVDRVPHAGMVYHYCLGGTAWHSGADRAYDSTLKQEADLAVSSHRSHHNPEISGAASDLHLELEAGQAADQNLATVLRELSLRGVRPWGTVTGEQPVFAQNWRVSLSSTNVDLPDKAVARWPEGERPAAPVATVAATARSPGTSGANRMIVCPRAVILLGGNVRPTRLSAAIGRSLLDLPVGPGQSILECWHEQVADLAHTTDHKQLELRVLVDQSSRLPSGPVVANARVQRDSMEFRGTGGILADVAAEYEDDDYLLVVGGVHILLRPLREILEELCSTGGDVIVGSHRDRTPSCVMLCRRRALGVICERGFVDFKEQALPLIARDYSVRVCENMQLTGLPVKTESQYIAALRGRFAPAHDSVSPGNPFAEEWRRRFALVEAGAEVDDAATIHDSVILRGSQVRAGAAVVQSVVCPGVVIGKRAIVSDALVSGSAARIAREQG